MLNSAGSLASRAHNSALVSIGLPVYNGEKYLPEALASLTAQDYDNFELIISDNCSTDQTAEICHAYAAKDSRIRYYRNQTNEGPASNFERVLELAKGTYFMWAAHDDQWDPSFVRKCVEMLENTPQAVLVSTYVRIIDEEGNQVSHKTLVGASHPHRATRLRQFLSCQDFAYSMYGLARRDALNQVFPLKGCWGSDFILLAKLCLLGTIVVIPESLFSYRIFQDKTHQAIAANMRLKARRTMLLHNRDTYFGLVRAIRSSDLPAWERRKITLVAAFTFGKQWPRWIKTSLAGYAYPKYLLPAIKNRESGNRRLAAYYAIRAMAANPFYILSRTWIIPLEAAIGPRLSGMVRRFVRRFSEGQKA